MAISKTVSIKEIICTLEWTKASRRGRCQMASSMEHLLRQQRRVIFNQVFGTETNFKVDWDSEELKNGLLFEKYKYQFILRISETSGVLGFWGGVVGHYGLHQP